jgi:hypothetical protein
MSFKADLLKKLTIDRLAAEVIGSLKPLETIPAVDKVAMKRLLEFGGYRHRRERDLDLYLKTPETDERRILVLDNDLAIYTSTVEDVALRKSPTIKEMISIKNAIKILNDSDVVISKKETSVQTVKEECVAMLDLTFNASDIKMIAKDGADALALSDTDGVMECLAMFAELLNYTAFPDAFAIDNHKIIGAIKKKEKNIILFGPVVLYDTFRNTLKLIDQPVDGKAEDTVVFLQRVATGKEKTVAEGALVFEYLKETVNK